MADATDADDPPRDRDDVHGCPAGGLVDQQKALRAFFLVLAQGLVVTRLTDSLVANESLLARLQTGTLEARDSRAAASIGSRTSASFPFTSAPAARTCPPPPQRLMSADASTAGGYAEVRQDPLSTPSWLLEWISARAPQ